ncbi:hypothetical protein BH10PSE16_BH10PSE16_01070 [soil metagenome]
MNSMQSPTRCPHGIRWHFECQSCRLDDERVQQRRAANALLDRRREGADMPPESILRALRLVGEVGSRVNHQWRKAC